ncbi:MAG TPA: tetratricopeptide repeat protein [Tepidisphaeraceae bacterium]|nr:tetratricopeptide repeat protein [Tepidisphaeraceae bacterium]
MPDLNIHQSMLAAIEQHQAGRVSEAQAIYEQVLAANPNHPDALHLLGVAMFQSKQPMRAIELIERAIAINPLVPDFHWNLGRVLATVGRHEQAANHFRRALVGQPDHPDIWNDLGNALQISGQWQQSIAAYHQVLARRPDDPDALNNLGNALREGGQLDFSIRQLLRAIELRPDFPEAHNNLGNAYQAVNRFDDAIAEYQKSLSLRPDYAQAYNNLGGALRASDKLDEAIASFNRAISLRPDFADAYNNLGATLLDQDKTDQAIATYRRAIELRPDFAEAHHNLSIALLSKGDYAAGWAEHGWRWQMKELIGTHQRLAHPQWTGEPLNGKRLFLHAEQGFGDTLQFVRYLPLAAQRGATIILACQRELVRLLKTMEGIAEILTEGDPLPSFDVHCPLLSLPGIFGTTEETIPVNIPYLKADEVLSSRWRKRVEQYSEKLKVGITWSGSATFKLNHRRSVTLDMLSPLFDIENVQFFSLQKGETSSQTKGTHVIDWTDELIDFAETAALIDNLDLVISVDTSVVHLAGALGKRVWVLLGISPDWRWLRDRTDSPWYPAMRLFRKSRMNDWTSVIDQVAQELACLK